MHEHPRITFGPFVLNPGTGTLLRHGVPVPLGYRALLLLTAFLDRPGEVLTKSDLIDAAWDGAAVEETNLSVQIASLRKHLGQAPEGGDWIATIHRVGYRFVGPVHTKPDERPHQEASAAASRIEKPLSRTSPAAPIPQQIHYCTAPDGVRLAYATTGEGYPLLKCANWMSDLQYDWDSSVWRHWIAELSDRNRLIRYDQRGNGLSDRVVEDLSFAAQLSDLETVADMACPERFALLGISAGAAVSVAYAARHPKRVSHLILYGGRPRGWKHSGTQAYQAQRAAMSTLIREGWGQDNPAFRQMFTSLFIPDATPEQMHWYNELQRRTVIARERGTARMNTLETLKSRTCSGKSPYQRSSSIPSATRSCPSISAASSRSPFRAPASWRSTVEITSCSPTSRPLPGSSAKFATSWDRRKR